MTKVEDVVTRRVIKIYATEIVGSWLENQFKIRFEDATGDLHNTGKADELKLLFAKELERNLRFAEAVQAAKAGNSQPMLDFFVDPSNLYCLLPFEKEVTQAKEEGLERELVIRFEHLDTPFELVFDENQVRLIETRF